MSTLDFKQHNEEVKQVWESFQARKPVRVPMSLGIGPRIWILDPSLNTEGITWEAFSNDPELMFQTQLKYKYYVHHHLRHDIEMGIPENGWDIFTEFVNVTEENWLGAELYYPPNQVTATRPPYEGDRKNEIFERGIPDPFSGIFARVKEYYEYFQDRAKNYEFHGKPVKILPPCPVSTDGIFMVAFNLRGTDLLTDMVLDPDYFHALMKLVTEALILKIKAWRTYLGMPEKLPAVAFGDDAIEYISTEMYKEYVMPYHKHFINELGEGGPHAIHLCGNVQRHLPTLVKELNIKAFDTGYPINMNTLRDEVGDDVDIYGGVLIMDLLEGTPELVKEKAKTILQSGIMRGGRFVFKESNNLPPCVPMANLEAMYETVREYGRYQY